MWPELGRLALLAGPGLALAWTILWAAERAADLAERITGRRK